MARILAIAVMLGFLGASVGCGGCDASKGPAQKLGEGTKHQSPPQRVGDAPKPGN